MTLGPYFAIVTGMSLWRWGLFVVALIFGPNAHAYLQYSLRYNQQSCTGCHFSPAGGGPKTLNGKLFGANNLKFNPVLAQKYLSADFRVLYYLSQETGASKGGMGVMSGAVAGHAALDEDERAVLVLEHNVGGFSAAPYRDTYAMFRPRSKWLNSVAAGRFRAPFGIVTDEHRTYTRLQTNTEWYSFETGALLSGDPAYSFHYDLAVVNGTHSPGSSLGTGQGNHWGSILNLRFLRTPYLAGASGSYFRTSGTSRSRAASAYGGYTWRRWAVLGEFVRAEGFNSNLARGFVSNPSYAETVTRSVSCGWMGWLEYEVNPRFVGIYKFDLLTPDRDFPADQYERHGLGFRWNVAPFVWVWARAEKARATHPAEKQGTGLGRMDAAYAILQVTL